MARIKEHPVTQILNLIESLSTDEKRIIYDRVRPAPKPRQKGEGRARTRQVLCVINNCFLPAGDRIHQPTTEGYHPFRGPAGAAAIHTERKPSQKRKAGKEATPARYCAECGLRFEDNNHHLPSMPDYHEFVEPAGETKGTSVSG